MQMSATEESTESLLVPVMKKDRFILGDLYGEISPNGMALRMLATNTPGPPPVQIARRFCVDLSICDAVEFLEYEWFSDGKVIVSMHMVDLEGDYAGHSIVLDCGEDIENNGPCGFDEDSPLKAVMRMQFTETVDCDVCKGSRARCSCEGPRAALVDLSPNGPDSCLDWMTWISAFAKTRHGLSTNTVSFRAVTPMGEIPGCMSFRLEQSCEMGQESGLALLRRSYEQLRAKQLGAHAEEAVIENADAVEKKVYETIELSPHSLLPHASDSLLSTDRITGVGGSSQASVTSELPGSTESPSPARKPRKGSGSLLQAGGVRKKVFTCECGVEFSHKGHLNVHIMTKHKRLRPHACTECTATFAKRSDLRRHAKALHKMQSLNDDEDAAVAISNRPFPCNNCVRRYATRQGLRKHQNSKHSENVSPQSVAGTCA